MVLHITRILCSTRSKFGADFAISYKTATDAITGSCDTLM